LQVDYRPQLVASVVATLIPLPLGNRPRPNPRADHPAAVAACRAKQIEPADSVADRRTRRATAGWPRRSEASDHGGTPRRANHPADVAKGDHDAKRRAALADLARIVAV
jgi:hypothetical protein